MVTAEQELTVSSAAVPEVIVAPEVVAPEPDRWAEFDGTTTGIPVEAPVAEAGEATPPVAEIVAPEPAPVIAPPIDPRVQQELDTLRRRDSQREAQVLDQENQRGYQTAVDQIQKDHEDQDSLTPQRAQEIAQRYIGAEWRAYTAERNAQQQLTQIVQHFQNAIQLSEQHKVPIRSLLRYNSLQEMQQAVAGIGAQNAQTTEIANLKAQVAKLTKGSVPAQTFSPGVTEGSGTAVTPDNIDALYLKDPVRYGPAYRKFLANQ